MIGCTLQKIRYPEYEAQIIPVQIIPLRSAAATNNTPIEYLQRVRIEAAKKALEDKDWPLNEVMNATGYKDMKTFRMIFKRIAGLSPQGYRKNIRGMLMFRKVVKLRHIQPMKMNMHRWKPPLQP